MASLLLTGASGLIGSALQRLMSASYPHLAVAPCSRRELPDEKAWNRLAKFDLIIHAAGYAAPAEFTKQPMQTAFLGTTALMTLLNKLNPGGRLLFLSSSEVYSGCNTTLHSEDDIGTTKPNSARGIYIDAKRCGEAICHAAREAGTTAIAARVSLAYGPGVKRGDKRVMSELIDLALKTGQVTLKDGGQARRSYCYVDDIAAMLLNIATKGQMGLYNVGGKSEATINGLAQRIGRLTGATVSTPYKIRSGAAMEGAPAHVALNMGRYIREFGEPSYVDWDQGLASTIAWHRKLSGMMAEA